MGFKLKKILLRVGIILAALIMTALTVRAVFNYTAGRKLVNFLDQMKAEGIPVTLKEMEPDCDPRYNAALDWKKAEASLSIEIQERGLLAKAIEGFFYGNPLEKDVKEQATELALKNREAINFMLEASNKSCFKSHEGWEDYSINLDYVKMIQGTRLFGIDAVLKADEGNVEEAINQCLSMRKFLKLHLQEPFIINYLVSMGCMKLTAVCLNYMVSDRTIKTDTLEKIIQEWDVSPWNKNLEWKLETERASVIGNSLLYLRGEIDLDWMEGNEVYYWLFRPVFKKEITRIPRIYDRLIEKAKMSYYQSRDSKGPEKFMNETLWYYKSIKMMVPNIEALLLKRASLNAIFDTAQIGMACKIYKNEFGYYPDKLSELSPEILKNIPVDPFTGKSYVYRKEDSGFIVYSVGSNQKDDGGKGTWLITRMVAEKDDDWAWETKK